ncbi:MAG: CDGSH iron-sulfur domain-containing protein [Phycisphaerae bacterium]|nr:CDGSH iron-sulfur domain-containing protein [Phycisphaerae bacterium]
MARLVRHEQTAPYRIDPADFPKDGKSLFICACGLTSTPPRCDASHKACKPEVPGMIYIYDPATKGVTDSRPDAR